MYVNKKKNNTNITAGKTRILVVDDHPIVRDGVSDLLNLEADFVVVARAGNIAEAIEAVKEQQIDLALVDMLLKDETGIQATKKIKALCPGITVMIFSMSDDLKHIEQAFDAGARGYIIKDEVSEKIIDAIRQVLDGGVYLSERLAKKFSKHELNEFLVSESKLAIPKLNEFLVDDSKPAIPKGVVDNT
jgi:DNA-binding NarL/FixJ family response regulator